MQKTSYFAKLALRKQESDSELKILFAFNVQTMCIPSLTMHLIPLIKIFGR